MTSDHLGTRIEAPVTPGELLLGTPGYTFGLGFAVRQAAGVAGVPGSAGEFMWARLRRNVLLGRSEGADRRRVHDAGAEPDPRLLPEAVQAARLRRNRGLRLDPRRLHSRGILRPSSGEYLAHAELWSSIETRRPRAIGECFDIE